MTKPSESRGHGGASHVHRRALGGLLTVSFDCVAGA
jgi:hypothetical protein